MFFLSALHLTNSALREHVEWAFKASKVSIDPDLLNPDLRITIGDAYASWHTAGAEVYLSKQETKKNATTVTLVAHVNAHAALVSHRTSYTQRAWVADISCNCLSGACGGRADSDLQSCVAAVVTCVGEGSGAEHSSDNSGATETPGFSRQLRAKP